MKKNSTDSSISAEIATVDVCCDTVERWISSDSTGRCPDWVQTHVATCAECRAELEAPAPLREQGEWRRARGEVSDPIMTRSVMAAVRAEPAPVSRAYARLRRRAAAAAVLLGLAIGTVAWGVMSAGETEEPSPNTTAGITAGAEAVPIEAVATRTERPGTWMMQPSREPLAVDFISVADGSNSTFSM